METIIALKKPRLARLDGPRAVGRYNTGALVPFVATALAHVSLGIGTKLVVRSVLEEILGIPADNRLRFCTIAASRTYNPTNSSGRT